MFIVAINAFCCCYDTYIVSLNYDCVWHS